MASSRHADLAHLDARTEDARQVAHQRAEVDTIFGRKVDQQAATVKVVVAANDLDVEVVFARLGAADGQRLGLFLLPQVALHHVPGVGAAHDRLHVADDVGIGDNVRRLDNLRHLDAARRIDKHVVAAPRSRQSCGSKW